MKAVNSGLKGLVLAMSVAVFVFAASDSFAKKHKIREPDNVISSMSLPNYYNVCFEKVGGELLKSGSIICKLPNEKYGSSSKKELLAFMDNKNNVYVGLIWHSNFTNGGLVLHRFNIRDSKWEEVKKIRFSADVVNFDVKNLMYDRQEKLDPDLSLGSDLIFSVTLVCRHGIGSDAVTRPTGRTYLDILEIHGRLEKDGIVSEPKITWTSGKN